MDENYATSYAAILELMYSQTELASRKKGKGLKVVPIILNKIPDELPDEVADDILQLNTEEVKVFCKTLDLLKKVNIDLLDYFEDGNFTKSQCLMILTSMLEQIKAHEIQYYEYKDNIEKPLNDIADRIKNDKDWGDKLFAPIKNIDREYQNFPTEHSETTAKKSEIFNFDNHILKSKINLNELIEKSGGLDLFATNNEMTESAEDTKTMQLRDHILKLTSDDIRNLISDFSLILKFDENIGNSKRIGIKGHVPLNYK